MFNYYYSKLNEKEYWNWELQKELAELSITCLPLEYEIDVDNPPYIFTKLKTYHEIYTIISQLETDIKDWELSPDGCGGVDCAYLGVNSRIFNLDVNDESTLIVDYFSKTDDFCRTVFSYEVPLEIKITELRKLKLCTM